MRIIITNTVVMNSTLAAILLYKDALNNKHMQCSLKCIATCKHVCLTTRANSTSLYVVNAHTYHSDYGYIFSSHI